MQSALTKINLLRLSVRSVRTMSSTTERYVDFFEAIDVGDIEKVDEMLKTNQVHVETRNTNEENSTALHRAGFWGHDKIVQLLVDTYKADVNATDDSGQIPLEVAMDNYHARICKFLIKRHSNKAEYASAVMNPPDIEDFVEAAESNDIAKVSEMIESKAIDVNSRDKGSYNGTILHVAARNGYEDLVRILVEKYRANINLTDEIGDRPVDVAAQNNNNEILEFLMAREKTTENA